MRREGAGLVCERSISISQEVWEKSEKFSEIFREEALKISKRLAQERKRGSEPSEPLLEEDRKP